MKHHDIDPEEALPMVFKKKAHPIKGNDKLKNIGVREETHLMIRKVLSHEKYYGASIKDFIHNLVADVLKTL